MDKCNRHYGVIDDYKVKYVLYVYVINSIEIFIYFMILILRFLFQDDPPDGIRAEPLDSSCCHWHASIWGPSSSPYEG